LPPQESIFSAAGRDLIQLLQSMLTLDPRKRCSCTQALKMDYFRNKPPPSLGHQLPLPASVREELGRTSGQAVGSKRKILDGVESSGLAKRLVF
jgi:cyclin-dependent kinase 7